MLKLRCCKARKPIKAIPDADTGLAALEEEDTCIALRAAMHVKGPRTEELPLDAKNMLAARFILSRTVVNERSAGEVLSKCFACRNTCCSTLVDQCLVGLKAVATTHCLQSLPTSTTKHGENGWAIR